jgi:hypothetical protein
VITTLLFALDTALPEQEAFRPRWVKNTRPVVLAIAPSRVHADPVEAAAALLSAGPAAAALVGGTVTDAAAFAGAPIEELNRAPPVLLAGRSNGRAARNLAEVQ